jgi:threonine 3-dehydrogenase
MAKKMMHALMKTGPGPGLGLVSRPIPKPGSGEVLIKVTAASICGTDSLIYEWADWAANRMSTPRIIGHEFAGVIEELGHGVSGWKKGERVSAESHIFCGRCLQCTTGRREVCREVRILGVDTDGAFAGYLVMPSANLWRNHPGIPDEIATIQEPLGNAVDTTLAEDVTGKSVLITGAGPIGLMCAALARACGAELIIVSDPNPYRRNLAKKLGADVALDPKKQSVPQAALELTKGSGVEVFLEISGASTALADGLTALTPGGRASLLGIYHGPERVDLNSLVIFKRIRIYGITGRKVFQTWHTLSGLLSSGRLKLDKLITHRMPMTGFEKAFDLMARGKCGKVVFTP